MKSIVNLKFHTDFTQIKRNFWKCVEKIKWDSTFYIDYCLSHNDMLKYRHCHTQTPHTLTTNKRNVQSNLLNSIIWIILSENAHFKSDRELQISWIILLTTTIVGMLTNKHKFIFMYLYYYKRCTQSKRMSATQLTHNKCW